LNLFALSVELGMDTSSFEQGVTVQEPKHQLWPVNSTRDFPVLAKP